MLMACRADKFLESKKRPSQRYGRKVGYRLGQEDDALENRTINVVLVYESVTSPARTLHVYPSFGGLYKAANGKPLREAEGST
jgi:hypothetical protein